MKITMKPEAHKTRRPFPRLMISQGNIPGQIVFFIEDGCGTTLASGLSEDKAGAYSDSFNMDYFEDYVGSVILEND